MSTFGKNLQCDNINVQTINGANYPPPSPAPPAVVVPTLQEVCNAGSVTNSNVTVGGILSSRGDLVKVFSDEISSTDITTTNISAENLTNVSTINTQAYPPPTPTLQEVCDAGSETNTSVTVSGIRMNLSNGSSDVFVTSRDDLVKVSSDEITTTTLKVNGQAYPPPTPTLQEVSDAGSVTTTTVDFKKINAEEVSTAGCFMKLSGEAKCFDMTIGEGNSNATLKMQSLFGQTNINLPFLPDTPRFGTGSLYTYRIMGTGITQLDGKTILVVED